MNNSEAAGRDKTGERRRKFTRWIYFQRIIGLAFGFFCVAAVLYPKNIPTIGWALTGAAGFLWPHLAFLHARRDAHPLRAEIRNLQVDSFIGGFFLPVISFNILPSATFVAMLSMNNIGVGGLRLFLKGGVWIAAGVLLSGLLLGFGFDPATPTLLMAVTLPMLVAYPLMTGAIAYKFSSRLRQKNIELLGLYEELREHVATLEDSNARLKAAEEKYRRLTEEISDTIYEVGSDGTITYISPAVTPLTGFKPEEFVGKSFTELIHPHDLEFIRQRFAQAISGKAQPSEYRLKTKMGGSVWVRSLSKAILSEKGSPTGIRGVLNNIEDLKRAERERAEFLSTRHERQKVEMLGSLAGGIAHDFNNILAAILGYSEMLAGCLKEDGKGSGYLEGLKKSTERAAGLVRQILAVSGQREERVTVVDLCEVAGEAANMLRAAIPASIAVECLTPGRRLNVLADPNQLHQVVMNLGTNAYQAMMERGGRLTLSLGVSDTPVPAALLTVADTGPGIPPGVAERIFDPYFTTKEVGKGSGLGLAVVKGIVTSYGGEISFTTRPGEGTTFNVLLPLCGESVPAKAPMAEEIPEGTERILFVDDEAALLTLGEEMLGSLGYKVRAVGDPATALGIFREDPGAWDLVITDQTMHGMTGKELTRELLVSKPGLPVLICTGFSEAIGAEAAAQAGAAGFMHKPYRLASLAVAVRKALDASAAAARLQ